MWTTKVILMVALPCFIAGAFFSLMVANIVTILRARWKLRRIKKRLFGQYGIDIDRQMKEMGNAPVDKEKWAEMREGWVREREEDRLREEGFYD